MAKPVGRRGETRERVLAAALELFSVHGFGGTSLQMIADHLGLTKAAVYYQFQTKEDIAVAVVQPVFDQMAIFVEAAEGIADRPRQLDTALEGLVDLVIDHRQTTAALHGDPGINEIIQNHPELQKLIERLTVLLTGPAPDPATLIASSMLGGGLMVVGVDPQLKDIDRATLRFEMMRIARQLLNVEQPRRSTSTGRPA